MFWLRNKKISFSIHTLNQSPECFFFKDEASEKEKSRKSGTSTPVVENVHNTDPKSEVDPAAAERKLGMDVTTGINTK